MGDYNPHAPYILGHEWVPIRQANYVPDTITERGYSFQLDHTVTPVSGVYYISEVPESVVAQSCDFISVYRSGEEDQTGPIKTLHIPPSAVATTDPVAIDITEGVAALLNPTDNKYIIFNPNGGGPDLQVNFDTAGYSQQLLGKRIIDFRLRYQIRAFQASDVQDDLTIGIDQLNLANSVVFYGDPVVVTETTTPAIIGVTSFTDMNPFWNASVAAGNQRDVLPWRWQEMNRFRSGVSPANDQLVVIVNNQINNVNSPNAFGLLGFMDLEVIYCEENRVLYGGRRTPNISISGFGTQDFYTPGPATIRMYNTAFTPGVVLTPNEYTVALSHRDIETRSIFKGTPEVYAVRQYYELPNIRGIQIHESEVDGAVFTTDEDSVITHITLHTATSIVTGVHAYGTSFGAPVYGARTAIQEIEDNPSSGTGVPYPQVRFYARRFADTTIPLTLVDVATGTSTVSISVSDFDALEEIVDGWREVTLRFATPPTFPVTAGDVDWRWQATGEVIGNQWQVLVSSGPSIATPTPFASALATGPATYWAPNGSTVALTWQSPTISGTAEDTTSDAVLIFSQDPPAVTGFAITQLMQAVTGVGTGAFSSCGHNAACVPVGVMYNQLVWNALGICDDFSTDQVDGWPNADSGQVWTNSGGSAPADYDVAGGLGMHTQSTINVARNSSASVSTGVSVTNAVVDVGVSATAAGDTLFAGPGIGSDTANIYQARLQFRPDGNAYLEVVRRVAGVQTTIFTALSIAAYAPNVLWSIRIMWQAGIVYARAWIQGQPEPMVWTAVVADANLTTFNTVVLRSQTGAASTNVNPVIYWDNFAATYAPVLDGSVEIQRRDSVTTDWQTIMLTESPACVGQFNDFEARVGILSEYRIRTLNTLDFVGPWVTGSGTVPSPGVVMANSGSANSVLIFTSNEQSASNLAYVMQWNGTPIEEFIFPEADTVVLQHMFGRDFAIAFHPLERGGERFNRTILVNAAAIAVPSLADFNDLRDLAWADLDYVCVRDELGNRWFATVIVPSGEVRSNRTVYLARITVSDATDTASPVDPAS